MLKKYLAHPYKKATIPFGIFLAITMVLGWSLKSTNSFSYITKHPFDSILLLIVFFIIFEVLTYLFLKFMMRPTKKTNEIAFFSASNKMFFIHMGIFIVIFALPFFIYFPGLWQYDYRYQLWMFNREAAWTTYHPFLHTMILGDLTKLGLAIFGKTNPLYGLTIYPIVQGLGFAAFFAWIMRKLTKLGVGNIARICVFIFLCLWPQNAYMSIITIKDTLFAISTVFLLFIFLEAFKNPDEFFTSWKKIIAFIGFSFLFCISRNNGYAAFGISIPFIILAFINWKHNSPPSEGWRAKPDGVVLTFLKRVNPIYLVTVTLIAIVLLNVIYNSFIFVFFDVTKGPEQEALPIPMMQVYACAIDGDLNQIQLQYFLALFGDNGSGGVDPSPFNPHFADPVKGRFNSAIYDANKSTYVKMYFDLMVKHPITYAEVGLNLNIGSWYMGNNYPASGVRGVYIERVDDGVPFQDFGYTIPMTNDVTSKLPGLLKSYDSYVQMKYMKYPVIGWIFRPSVAIYLLFLSFIALLFKKKPKMAIAAIPLFFLWLTVIAAPVFDGRYIYPLILCTPIMLVVAKNE